MHDLIGSFRAFLFGLRLTSDVGKIPGSGSFIRPTRKPDTPLSFIEGLRKKYTTDEDPPGKHAEIVLTANKVFEEIGFEKIIKKLSQLQELKIILLDGLRIDRVDDVETIRATCPGMSTRQFTETDYVDANFPGVDIEELDISRNRLEKLEDIALVCSALPRLHSLRINGNRLNSLAVCDANKPAFSGITSLEIANVLLDWNELSQLLSLFPNVKTLIGPHNELSTIPSPHPFPTSLTALDLSYNTFPSLSSISQLSSLPHLTTLLLAHNKISTLTTPPGTIFPSLTRLDLAYNILPTFATLDSLPSSTPHLTSMRISHNPLFSTDGITLEEAHMLAIGHLPSSVAVLNHSTITPKERENAEMWYLSRVAKELSTSVDTREAVLERHARWGELCKLHGEPAIAKEAADEKVLAAKLMKMVLVGLEKEVTKRVPIGMPLSTLRACVGKWFEIDPLKVRLVCVGGVEEETVLGGPEDTREVGLSVDGQHVRIRVECV